MDLSLESISLPPWDPARAEDWNEAYEKVENYLRACRVGSHLQRARLTALVLQRVYDRLQSDSGEGDLNIPGTAINEVRTRIEEWIGHYLPQQVTQGKSISLGNSMLALYLGDGPMRWPYAFLDSVNRPNELAEVIRARIVRTGPDFAFSSMVPRDIDLGLMPELMESAMESFEDVPVIRTIFAWTLFLGLLAFLFWYTH
jgi:hypothetical protein